MTEVKQYINLYLPRFQPETLSKEAKKLFLSILVILVILITVIVSIIVINSVVGNKISEKNLEGIVLAEELEKAISKIPNVTPDVNLINRISKEKLAIIKKQQVIKYLYQDTIGEGENFTDLVDQLAQQSVNGIWLNRFEVLNKGKDIQLFGYAKEPSQVSLYIEMLGSQNSYKGRNFQQIKIKKSTQGWNDFYISTLSQKELFTIDSIEVEQ
jgi:Tfp pilus assembly protein PilN